MNMATIKICTDIPQSKVLAQILPLESADMCYIQDLLAECKYGDYQPYIGNLIPAYGQGKIRCWSLASLLNVLPKPKVFYSTDKTNRWYCECWDSDGNFITFTKAGNPIDACVAMIEKLHELNLL